MKSKPILCEQCRQQQSDFCWFVAFIGFIAGAISAAIAAWIVVGIFHP